MKESKLQKAKDYIKTHKVEVALGAAGTATIIGLISALKMKNISYGTGVGVILTLQWVNKNHPEIDAVKEYAEQFNLGDDAVKDFILPS